jgi:hypothetical protein
MAMTAVAVESPTEVRVRRAVPWMTVLPLAVAMAYADGYWMTTLRGAVGSIARTQGPFASWLRESTLSIPLFVLAVLGAVTLSLRLFGPGRGTWRTVVGSMLLVIGAGTLVGLAEVAASSGYDYVLQSRQLLRMDSIHPMCVTANCLAVQQERSLWLQGHSVAYASIFLLITNLIVVGWIVALRGGRLDLAKLRTEPTPANDQCGSDARVERLVLLLVIALTGTAILHAAMMPAYVTLWPAGGVMFGLLTAVELALAACLLLLPRRGLLGLVAVVSAAPLSLWLLSSTVGLTLGSGNSLPANVGLAQVAVGLLQLGMLALALVLLNDGSWVHRPARASEHVRWMTVMLVVALTAIGLAGSGLPGFSDFSPGDQPVSNSSHSHEA